jgi:hypothetical protein
MTELTREQKIAKIYEEIAEKETEYIDEWWIYAGERVLSYGLVMLWDVLDWIESKIEDNYFWNFYIEDLIMDICNKRKHKRKPIDDQDEDCVSFVYSLIKDQWQTY